MPLPARALLVGFLAGGALGALVGLVVGLRVYPPTAWAAVIEVALPSALAGAVLGFLGGAFVWFFRRNSH